MLNSEIINTMCRDSSVVGLMNCVADDVRLVNSTDHVEVDRIPTKFESLSDIFQLNVANSSDA
jgi:hypothetical protein